MVPAMSRNDMPEQILLPRERAETWSAAAARDESTRAFAAARPVRREDAEEKRAYGQ